MAAISSLAAGYMLSGGYSWRLYFYVILAFAATLFLLTILFVEETSYDRKAAIAAESTAASSHSQDNKVETDQKEMASYSATLPDSLPPRKSYLQMLSLAGRRDSGISFFGTMLRSWTYFLAPASLWVITTYGINIGLGAFGISFTFPVLITAPPYNWDPVGDFLGSVCTPLEANSDDLCLSDGRRPPLDCSNPRIPRSHPVLVVV